MLAFEDAGVALLGDEADVVAAEDFGDAEGFVDLVAFAVELSGDVCDGSFAHDDAAQGEFGE